MPTYSKKVVQLLIGVINSWPIVLIFLLLMLIITSQFEWKQYIGEAETNPTANQRNQALLHWKREGTGGSHFLFNIFPFQYLGVGNKIILTTLLTIGDSKINLHCNVSNALCLVNLETGKKYQLMEDGKNADFYRCLKLMPWVPRRRPIDSVLFANDPVARVLI